jgi:hypothetical protein
MNKPLGFKIMILNRMHSVDFSPLLNIFWKYKRHEQNFKAVRYRMGLISKCKKKKEKKKVGKIIFTLLVSTFMLQMRYWYIVSKFFSVPSIPVDS